MTPPFRFWFRFVYGRTARYEVYGADAYTDLAEPELPEFVSGTFEQLAGKPSRTTVATRTGSSRSRATAERDDLQLFSVEDVVATLSE